MKSKYKSYIKIAEQQLNKLSESIFYCIYLSMNSTYYLNVHENIINKIFLRKEKSIKLNNFDFFLIQRFYFF